MARWFVHDLVKLCDEVLHFPAPIWEFGSYMLPGQEKEANLRPIFEGREFVGTDIRPGPGVDVVMDMMDIMNIANTSVGFVGTAISLDALEHVQEPIKAVEQMYTCLDQNGVLLLVSVMNFEIHERPDYWRFTPDAFGFLLRHFPYKYVTWAGRPNFPHTVIGVGMKGGAPLAKFEELDRLVTEWRDSLPIGPQHSDGV